MLIRLGRGDVAAAAELLLDVPAPPERLETLSNRYLALAQGEVALARGDAQTALASVQTVLAAVPDLSAWRDQTLVFLRYLEGRALAAGGRWDAAAAALGEAAEACQAQGPRPLFWRCRAQLARVQLAQRERTAAAAAMAAAEQAIADLVKTLSDEALREQFRRSALAELPRLPELSPLQQQKDAYGGLTQRERQIARLVARGKSNREIAAELFITVRTTKAHITKLDLTSRTQIAAWAVEKELLDSEI